MLPHIAAPLFAHPCKQATTPSFPLAHVGGNRFGGVSHGFWMCPSRCRQRRVFVRVQDGHDVLVVPGRGGRGQAEGNGARGAGPGAWELRGSAGYEMHVVSSEASWMERMRAIAQSMVRDGWCAVCVSGRDGCWCWCLHVEMFPSGVFLRDARWGHGGWCVCLSAVSLSDPFVFVCVGNRAPTRFLRSYYHLGRKVTRYRSMWVQVIRRIG